MNIEMIFVYGFISLFIIGFLGFIIYSILTILICGVKNHKMNKEMLRCMNKSERKFLKKI